MPGKRKVKFSAATEKSFYNPLDPVDLRRAEENHRKYVKLKETFDAEKYIAVCKGEGINERCIDYIIENLMVSRGMTPEARLYAVETLIRIHDPVYLGGVTQRKISIMFDLGVFPIVARRRRRGDL